MSTRLTNLSRNRPLRGLLPRCPARTPTRSLTPPAPNPLTSQFQRLTLSPPPRPLPSPHSTPSGSRSSQSPPTAISPRPVLSLASVRFLSNPGPEPPAHTLEHPQDPARGNLTISPRCSSLDYAGFPHSLLSSLPFRVLAPKPAGNWSTGGHGLQLPTCSTVPWRRSRKHTRRAENENDSNSQEAKGTRSCAGAESSPARLSGKWSPAASILARGP